VIDAYWRRADVIRVHDGDTLMLNIDLGFDVWTIKPLRLFGVNAPELSTEAGKVSRDWVQNWITTHNHGSGGGFSVRYVSWDKYAPRFDGVFTCTAGHNLNEELVAAGMAVRYG
jgi:micrococcal nuclease